MKATYQNTIIAQSDNTIIVEDNHYFPPQDVNMEYLVESSTQSRCPWKGLASYYSVKVNNNTSQDSAWYYPQPNEAANNIKGYIAFYKDVEITE